MTLFLVLLIGGIGLLVSGLFVTRLTWRPDVEPFGRSSSFLAIAVHPERFATGEKLTAIRLLNLMGGALLGGAVGVLIYELATATLGR